MADSLRRQWLMLSLLPRAPRKLDASRIETLLRDQGIVINRRTIQRDLITLSGAFPIACDERSKPYGWSWTRDARSFDLQAMSPHVALTLTLALELLRSRLPPATVAFLLANTELLDRALRTDGALLAFAHAARGPGQEK